MSEQHTALLEKLKQRVVPDECIVYVCGACRDTGYVESPDPHGREGSVLVRECRGCSHLSPKDRRDRWRKADREEQQRVREWRG